MKIKTVNQIFITNDSVFSTRKYKLENNGKLSIITLNAVHTRAETIPLDLIDPEPNIEHKPNNYWALISLVISVSSIITFGVTDLISVPLLSALILLSAALFVVALKNRMTTYTFFFANTQTKIFSIKGGETLASTNEAINDKADSFINNLKYAIYKINKKHVPQQKFENDKDKYDFIKNKLDDLYNYGVINNILYDRIKDNIREKTNTQKLSKQTKQLANVIVFEPRKKLQDTA